MPQFSRLEVYNTIHEAGMVPLFYHSDPEVAQQLLAALYRGGSRILEFTNRGDFAIEVFDALIKYTIAELPGMIVGVGSVEDAATAALYIAHGANFIVGPTFSEDLARMCNRRKVAYMPGCGSLNEIATAEEWGAEIVKAFPGSAVGGPGFVKAALAPRPWTSIMPTGGVTPEEDNLRKWFDAGVACVGMGSGLVSKERIASQDYAGIEQATRDILDLIAQIRS